MKIAMLAPFEESVPPKKYGGTELVIHNLTENLVKLGHSVTLIAPGDSKTRAKLRPVFIKSLRTDPKARDIKIREALKLVGIGRAVEFLSKHNFDVIHNHIGWRVLPFQHQFKSPVVTTLHGPLNLGYQRIIYNEFKNSNYISISLNQRKPMPDLNFIANVYNGLDGDKYKFSPKHKNYFLFLSRLSPEKGPLEAIMIAKAVKGTLLMAGKVDASDEVFFNKQIKPHIDGKRIKFLGEVSDKEKIKLLSGAKALLSPIQWEEPFGLMFVEAMAVGTPVISMRRGSVPEILLDGKTGFICDDIEDAIHKATKIETISRQECFDYLHDQSPFTARKMALSYIEAYKRAKIIK